MTGLPLWAYPIACALACCLLLAALLRWGERRRGIDMTALTNDPPRPQSSYTVDPSKLSTAEIHALHRMLAVDMASRPSELYVPRAWSGQ